MFERSNLPLYLLCALVPRRNERGYIPGFFYIGGKHYGTYFFLIGVAVVVFDFLLGDPIDWWMVILAFLASFLSLVAFSDVWND